jgi:hypothetical protein
MTDDFRSICSFISTSPIHWPFLQPQDVFSDGNQEIKRKREYIKKQIQEIRVYTPVSHGVPNGK